MIKFLKHILAAISLTTLTFVLIFVLFSSWLLYTTNGAKLAYYAWRKVQFIPFNLSIGEWQGNLVKGLCLKNLVLNGFSLLPIGTQARVQQIDITFKGMRINDAFGKFTNARLLLPGTDPLVVQASIDNGILSANIFAHTLDLGEIAKFLPPILEASSLKGFVSHVDVYLKGNVDKMVIDGRLIVDHIKFLSTDVSQGPGRFHLIVSPPYVDGGFQLNGEAEMTEGQVQARHIALDLGQSKVFYKGDPLNPQLDIHTSSVVDKINIDMTIKGTLRNPEIILGSDPVMPSDVLLVMLATGKPFSGTSAIKDNGKITGELVSDFIDYSLLGGQGGNLARRYGLSGSTEPYQDDKKIGLRKKITDDMHIGFEIEQMPYIYNQPTEYSKTVEGAVDVTDHLSINVSQKVLPREDKSQTFSTSENNNNPKAESQIYLKYKKNF